MKNEARVPFVARHRKLLAPSESSGPEHAYDGKWQLWVWAPSGEPLVTRHANRASPMVARSEFGETTLTKTIEGTDQVEGRGLSEASSNAAPPLARIRILGPSPFGETMVTETSEGTDQSERTTR